jgi:hypothetical protein
MLTTRPPRFLKLPRRGDLAKPRLSDRRRTIPGDQTLIPTVKKVKPQKDMTGKRKPNAARSAPNLGQREAEVQKVSETKLTRMKATTAHSAPGRFIAWCKQEQASIQQQLDLMETAKVLTGENRGSGWVDTTAESIERARARLVELESLLTESGPATVSKPKR